MQGMLMFSVIVAQVLIFLGFIFFFRSVLTRNVASATKHIDEMSEEYAKRDQEAVKRLEDAKKQAEEMVNKAVDEAETKKAEIMKNAEKQREDLVGQARTQSGEIMEQAERARERLISELEQRITKEAINKASELVQFALPEELKIATHSKWVKDLIESGFDKIGEVKIVEGIKQVRVVSAFPLTENDRGKLLKKVNGLLGNDAELREELDPKIVAGIIVEIGSLVLDGSLRNRILEQTSMLDRTGKGVSGG